MCGDAGAGSLKKEIMIQRLSGALQGIYGSDLDYVFGNIKFLSRTSSESYPYNTTTDMLTSDQWSEVAVKDEWYRNRIREFFIACGLGGTTDGIRQIVHAATSVDCDILESWRWVDNFGLSNDLGRTGTSLRSEFVVVPHKENLEPHETRSLRDMLDRLAPQDSVYTISTTGLAVSAPVKVRAIAADSTYYQVEKVVTPTPVVAKIPSPELLAYDLNDSEKWLFSNDPVLAPYAQFGMSSEYSYYYLASGDTRSPIDAVMYSIIDDRGNLVDEQPFEWYEEVGALGPWTDYETADSPDNYPGGKFGLHPQSSPALNPNGSSYRFPFTSQAEYVARKKAEVQAAGGYADDFRYRYWLERPDVAKKVYAAEWAIACTAPGMDSTITSSWMSRRTASTTPQIRSSGVFVRS